VVRRGLRSAGCLSGKVVRKDLHTEVGCWQGGGQQSFGGGVLQGIQASKVNDVRWCMVCQGRLIGKTSILRWVVGKMEDMMFLWRAVASEQWFWDVACFKACGEDLIIE